MPTFLCSRTWGNWVETILQFCLVCHPISKRMWLNMIWYNFKKMYVDWHWLNHTVEVGTYLPCLRHLLDLSDIFQYQLHLTHMNLGHPLSLSTFNCGSNTSFLLDFPQYSNNAPWKHNLTFPDFPGLQFWDLAKTLLILGLEYFTSFMHCDCIICSSKSTYRMYSFLCRTLQAQMSLKKPGVTICPLSNSSCLPLHLSWVFLSMLACSILLIHPHNSL